MRAEAIFSRAEREEDSTLLRRAVVETILTTDYSQGWCAPASKYQRHWLTNVYLCKTPCETTLAVNGRTESHGRDSFDFEK